MRKGRIIKLIGGQYTILDAHGERIVLKPRGVFRHRNQSPKVGDIVRFDEDFIRAIEPRYSELARPPIANVDQALLINSAKAPDFSFFLLDRFLVLAAQANVDAVIVVNKIDLLQDSALSDLRSNLAYYEQFYPVYFVSAKQQATLDELREVFKGKVNVFAGQTGSGKSSILNTLEPSLELKTGAISKALGRGRHTTRHTELIELAGGLVADTPGFSKLDFYEMEEEDLGEYYPDFFERSDQCRFRGCAHINEPGCAVKQAVETGDIPKRRYDNYVRIYEELSEQKTKY